MKHIYLKKWGVIFLALSAALCGTVLPAHDWTADFIWSDAERGDNPPVTYFRKSFELAQVPKSATLTATGSRFKVYVNGAFAGEGVPHNVAGSSYTVSFDVANMLRTGENVIAVEAQYANPARNSPVAPLFSAVLEADGSRIETDSSWKVFISPAWLEVEGHSSGRDFIEVYQSSRDPEGWKEPGFQDGRWKDATVTPADKVRYKSVAPAIIPNFVREKILPVAVTAVGEVVQILGDARVNVGMQLATETLRPLKYGKINAPENLLKADAVTVIEPQVYVDNELAYDTWWQTHKEMPVMRDVSFIVDFGAIHNAYIAMDLEGNTDTTIDIAWGQTLIDGQVKPIVYSRNDYDAAGTAEHQFAMRWTLRGGRQQLESMNYKNFRYLQVTVRDLTEPLKIHEIAAIESFVPMQQRGSFACSDPFLTELFAANLRTLQAASYDTFMDNTIREKNIWAGGIADGSVPTALAGYGDSPMQRNYLKLFVEAQFPNGEFAMVAGSGQPSSGMAIMSIPMRMAFWLAEYGYWCEDYSYYQQQIIPAVLRYREFWKARMNEDGMLPVSRRTGGNPGQEAVFVDWSSNTAQGDFKANERTVYVPWNLLYAGFLDRLAVETAASGMAAEAEAARQEADVIREWIFTHCWDDERGLYFDGYNRGKPVRTYSEHGAQAISAGKHELTR